MSCTSGQDRNVARFQDKRASFAAAELNAAAAARDTKHFVNARVVVSVIVNAVAP
jgi:hypothetical protein